MRGHLKRLLTEEVDFSVIAEAGDGNVGLRLVEQLHPDVLVTDLMMPGTPGLQVILQIHRERPETAIVVVTIHAEGPYVKEAFLNGARAFVLKDKLNHELIPAVRTAVAGRSYISTSIAQLGVRVGSGRAMIDLFDTLTLRERAVFELAAAGCADEVIAARLSLNPEVTAQLRSAVMLRLGARTQAELAGCARAKGLPPGGHSP